MVQKNLNSLNYGNTFSCHNHDCSTCRSARTLYKISLKIWKNIFKLSPNKLKFEIFGKNTAIVRVLTQTLIIIFRKHQPEKATLSNFGDTFFASTFSPKIQDKTFWGQTWSQFLLKPAQKNCFELFSRFLKKKNNYKNWKMKF